MIREKSLKEQSKLSENDMSAIADALSKGLRVELLKDKDGNIIIQTIQRKRLILPKA